MTDNLDSGHGPVDVPALLAELRHCRAALWAARLNYANLVAAGRAALAAQAEGEADPWWYLRDELPSSGPGRGWSR